MFDVVVLVLFSVFLLAIVYLVIRFAVTISLGISFYRKNNTLRSVKLLKKDILEAKNTLYIYSGNCDKNTFNNPEIEDAFISKNDKLDIIIIIEESLPEDNKVSQYYNNGHIKKLMVTKVKYPYHFRIVDNKRVFIEKHIFDKKVEKQIRKYKITYKSIYVIHFKRIFFNIFKNCKELEDVA